MQTGTDQEPKTRKLAPRQQRPANLPLHVLTDEEIHDRLTVNFKCNEETGKYDVSIELKDIEFHPNQSGGPQFQACVINQRSKDGQKYYSKTISENSNLVSSEGESFKGNICLKLELAAWDAEQGMGSRKAQVLID